MDGKMILLVDDEFDILSSLELVLDMEGYSVHLAYNGKQAMDILKEGLRPNLIMSDIMMPVMNGYDLYGALSAHPEYSEIPLILMSAAQLDGTRLANGIRYEFIRKPFDLYKLTDVVRKAIK